MPEPKNPVDRFFYYLIRSAFLKTFLLVVLIGGAVIVVFAKPILNILQYDSQIGGQAGQLLESIVGTPTFTKTPQPTAIPWHWVQMDEHDMMVSIPETWTTDQIAAGTASGYPPCRIYFIVSPDRTGVVKITTKCGPFGGESLWNDCGINAVMISTSRNAVRVPRDGHYLYVTGRSTTHVGQYECSYGWLDMPWVLEITYESIGEYDFYTVDKILLSMQEYHD